MREIVSRMKRAAENGFNGISGTDNSIVAFALKAGLQPGAVSLLNNICASTLDPLSEIMVWKNTYDDKTDEYSPVGGRSWVRTPVDGTGKSVYEIVLSPFCLPALDKGNTPPFHVVSGIGLFEIESFTVPKNLSAEKVATMNLSLVQKQGFLFSKESSSGKSTAWTFLKEFKMELLGSQISRKFAGFYGPSHITYLYNLLEGCGRDFESFVRKFREHTGKPFSEVEPEALSIIVESKTRKGRAFLEAKVKISPDGAGSEKEIEVIPFSRKILLTTNAEKGGELVSTQGNIWNQCGGSKSSTY